MLELCEANARLSAHSAVMLSFLRTPSSGSNRFTVTIEKTERSDSILNKFPRASTGVQILTKTKKQVNLATPSIKPLT